MRPGVRPVADAFGNAFAALSLVLHLEMKGELTEFKFWLVNQKKPENAPGERGKQGAEGVTQCHI